MKKRQRRNLTENAVRRLARGAGELWLAHIHPSDGDETPYYFYKGDDDDRIAELPAGKRLVVTFSIEDATASNVLFSFGGTGIKTK